MSCADACIDMDYGGDVNDFYRELTRTARKAHTCCECRFTIPPGARYWYASGKSDGDVWSAKTCATCYEIRRALVCGAWVFGLLWEEIEQGVFPVWDERGPWDCLAQIESITARDAIRTRYDEYLKEKQ